MKIINLTYLAMILCFLTLHSCKYEDGPKISLRTKAERLSNKWKVNKAYISKDEQDVTHEWENAILEFKKNGSYIITKYSPDKTMKSEETGSWEFHNKKKQIFTKGTEQQIEVSTGNLIDESNYDMYYVIKRLKEKELHIWFTYNEFTDSPIHEYLELIPF